MTSGQISSELKLAYASSTITPKRLSERDLDILFESFHNEYLSGRPSEAPRTIPVAPISSHNVDALSQQHAQQQRNHTPSLTVSAADNVLNAVFKGDLFVNPFATPSTEFSNGIIDPTLFTRRFDDDTLVAQAKLTEKHLKEVKRIFRYLWGTVNTGLWYTKDSGFELTGFSDAEYAGCKDTFKSTSGGAHFLGENLVSWSSKKQDCTVSTAKAEYVSLSTCCAQVLWMRTQLTDYGFHFNKILIYCDSKSAIAISCNPVQHSRTKHIVVRYHFIKEHMENGTIKLYFVKTDYQLADIFTKALPVDRFNYLVRHLGMRSLSPQKLDRLAKS
nr:copia protein [Tanacetum cinerariifolium]